MCASCKTNARRHSYIRPGADGAARGREARPTTRPRAAGDSGNRLETATLRSQPGGFQETGVRSIWRCVSAKACVSPFGN